jgi:hypothetical protein
MKMMGSLKPASTVILLFFELSVQAQIGIGTPTPHSSAQLEVSSTTKGFLPPRMSASQRAGVVSPTAEGMIVYQNNETKGFYYYNGSSWVLLSNANYGDIKTGIQTTDHNGWVKLDGRAKISLTSTQQIQATSLGIGTNLLELLQQMAHIIIVEVPQPMDYITMDSQLLLQVLLRGGTLVLGERMGLHLRDLR